MLCNLLCLAKCSDICQQVWQMWLISAESVWGSSSPSSKRVILTQVHRLVKNVSKSNVQSDKPNFVIRNLISKEYFSWWLFTYRSKVSEYDVPVRTFLETPCTYKYNELTIKWLTKNSDNFTGTEWYKYRGASINIYIRYRLF